MDHAESLPADPAPDIKRDRDQQTDVHADDAQTHPDRLVIASKRYKQLADGKGNGLVQQQHAGMHSSEYNAKERQLFMECNTGVGADGGCEHACADDKSPDVGKPKQQESGQSGCAADIPPGLHTVQLERAGKNLQYSTIPVHWQEQHPHGQHEQEGQDERQVT